MAGYFSTLIDSFSPGGLTPFEALFGAYDQDGDSITSGNYNPKTSYDVIESIINSPDDDIPVVSDVVDSIADTFTPNTSEDLSDDYVNDIYDKLMEATRIQNEAAQSSADRAMEFTEKQNEIDRLFQADQAQRAMDYQTYMSNTAYQRAMDDMRKAGLNPKLVGHLGGAAAPSGVSASGTGGGQGVSASMSMQNISALAGVMETYITSANRLDLSENDFVQDVISSIVNGIFGGLSLPISSSRKIGF